MLCSIALTGECNLELIGASAPRLDLLTKLIIFGTQEPDPFAQQDEYGDIRWDDLVRQVDSGIGKQGSRRFCSLVCS